MIEPHRSGWAFSLLALMAFAPCAIAEAADLLVEAGCAGCHRVEAPTADERAGEDFSLRKAPDLYFAGNKYRPEWLRTWLQDPQPIRPAGMHPELHVVNIDGVDRVDPDTIEPHPVVAAEAIDGIVESLMKRRWGSDLLPAAVNVPSIPSMLAQLNFIKFKGCGSCHRTTPAYGGMSGPELYTAWRRLQPEFMWSYIANPQAWDPVAPMPGYGLSDQEVGKLVAYLRTIGTEDSP